MLWIIYITLNAYRIKLCNIYRIVKVQKKIDYVTSMFISILAEIEDLCGTYIL